MGTSPFKAQQYTFKDIYNAYLKERPYSILEKTERWIYKHSFVFMWLPIITVTELAYNLPLLLILPVAIVNLCLLIAYSLGIPIVALLSWDGHVMRNIDWYGDHIITNFLNKENHKVCFYIPVIGIVRTIPRSFIIRMVSVFDAKETADVEETQASMVISAFNRDPNPDTGGSYAVCSSCMNTGAGLGMSRKDFKDLISDCITKNKPFICPKCQKKNNFHRMFAFKNKEEIK